jgi:hypothetical protein
VRKFVEIAFQMEPHRNDMTAIVRAKNTRSRKVLHNCGFTKILRLEDSRRKYKDFSEGNEDRDAYDSQDLENDEDAEADEDYLFGDQPEERIRYEKQKTDSFRRLTWREERELRPSAILLSKLVFQAEKEHQLNLLVKYELPRVRAQSGSS